jgi:large subunit ribosomal protein L33
MAKTLNREWVSLQCPDCRNRNYRKPRRTKGEYKLNISKYCSFCRAHKVHLEKKK